MYHLPFNATTVRKKKSPTKRALPLKLDELTDYFQSGSDIVEPLTMDVGVQTVESTFDFLDLQKKDKPTTRTDISTTVKT